MFLELSAQNFLRGTIAVLHLHLWSAIAENLPKSTPLTHPFSLTRVQQNLFTLFSVPNDPSPSLFKCSGEWANM